MSKANKITFQTINSGKVKNIDDKRLADSNHRIKTAMAVVIRQHKHDEASSRIDARKLVLNA